MNLNGDFVLAFFRYGVHCVPCAFFDRPINAIAEIVERRQHIVKVDSLWNVLRFTLARLPIEVFDPGVGSLAVIKTMLGPFFPISFNHSADEGFGTQSFVIIDDFEFGFIYMLSISGEKTHKTFGLGLQTGVEDTVLQVKSDLGPGGPVEP